MNVLKKRPVAAVIAALVVCASTLLGVNRSVSSIGDNVSRSFFNGVYNTTEGYTMGSIYSQLEMRANAVNGILSLCKNTEQAALVEDLRAARAELVDELDYMDDDSIPELYKANQALQQAYDALMSTLQGSPILDDAAMDTYISNFANAQNVIDNAGYNELVSSFYNNTLSSFPVRFFDTFLDLDTPEYFK